MTDGEKIFKQFREHSVAEFFKKNRQMLGFTGKVRSLTMIIHEFVTNGQDALALDSRHLHIGNRQAGPAG